MSRELRALIYALPEEAFDFDAPENREAAEAIVALHYMEPLARGDIAATRATAREALKAELERQRNLPTVDDLVDLLRRTRP